MGYIKHDAIIVTAWDKKYAAAGRAEAIKIGLECTPISPQGMNGYCSFLICPDGSKEGWPESTKGEEQREIWKTWEKAQENIFLEWVHVSYGGDEPKQDGKIIDYHRRK